MLATISGRTRMGSLITATFTAVVLSLLATRPADAQQPNPASVTRRQAAGSFRCVDPGSNRPITAWFCRTSTTEPDTRIVFIMHGSDAQTARRACDLASPYIDPLKAIVLAPQFAEEYFPGDSYMFGNMIDAAGKVLPKSAWALTAIERLFDLVRDEMGLQRTEYDLPYGLKGSPIDRMLLTKAFSRDLVVLLGDRDVTDREREAGSMEQGTTRAALELLRP